MSLCTLAEMGERNKALVREQGGIGDVIEAMRMYREHTGLQKEACSALASLAADSECRRLIWADANGAREAILAAVVGPRSGRGAARFALVALARLCDTPRFRPHLLAAGVCALLTDPDSFDLDHPAVRCFARMLSLDGGLLLHDW